MVFVNITDYFERKLDRIPNRWMEFYWFLLLFDLYIFPLLFVMNFRISWNSNLTILFLVIWMIGIISKGYQFFLKRATSYFAVAARRHFLLKKIFAYSISALYWFHPLVQKAIQQYLMHAVFADDTVLIKSLSRNEKIRYALSLKNHSRCFSSAVTRKRMALVLQDKNMNLLRIFIVCSLYLLQLTPLIGILCLWR